MGSQAPWSVKGIEPQTRVAAKAAAQQAGLTVGAWLSRVIMDSDSDEDKKDGPPAKGSKGTPLPSGDDPTSPQTIGQLTQTVKSLSKRLDQADQTGSLSLEKIEQSVSEIASRLDNAPNAPNSNGPNDGSGALVGLQRSIVDLTTRIEMMESAEENSATAKAIDDLDDAISKVATHVTESERRRNRSIEAIQRTLNDLSTRVQTMESSHTDAVLELERGLSDLRVKLQSEANNRISTVEEVVAANADLRHRFDSALESSRDAIAVLDRRVSESGQRLSTVDRRLSDAVKLVEQALEDRLAETDRSLAGLRDRLKTFERKSGDSNESALRDLESANARLSEKLEASEQRTATAITNTETALREMQEKFSRKDRQTKEAVVALSDALTDIGRRLQAVEERASNASTDGPSSPVMPNIFPQRREEEAGPSDTETTDTKADVSDPSEIAKTEKEAETRATKAPQKTTDVAEEVEPKEDEATFQPWSSDLSEEEVEGVEADPQEPKEVSFHDDENRGRIIGIAFVVLIMIVVGAGLLTWQYAHLEYDADSGRPDPFSSFKDYLNDLISFDLREWLDNEELAAIAFGTNEETVASATPSANAVFGEDETQTNAADSNAIATPFPATADLIRDPFAAAAPVTSASAKPIHAVITNASFGVEAYEGETLFRTGMGKLVDSTDQDNLVQAARWIEAAAVEGHLEAQYLIASLYERGIGVTKERNTAIVWYERSASSGHMTAMYNLGVLLADTATSSQDYVRSAFWFAKAAENGLVDAQVNIGTLYERGNGLPKSVARAYAWYNIAALSGDEDAAKRRARLAPQLTPQQLSMAEDMTEDWRRAQAALN